MMEIIKNVAKRMLSLTLAVVMMLSMLPTTVLQVQAAGSWTAGQLGAENLSAADRNGKWTLKDGTLTGTVSSTAYKAASGCEEAVDASGASDTLTFTYTGQYGAVLTFTLDIIQKDNGSVTVNNAPATDGTHEIEVSKGDTVTVSIETAPTGDEDKTVRKTSVAISDISVDVIVELVDTTFAPASGGTYTVDGETISANTTKQKTSTDSYAVKAEADDGYAFLGWWSEADQKFLADAAEATLIVGKNTTITPMFQSVQGLAMFGVGDQTFYNLTLASQYAKANGPKQINLLNTGTLYGTHTIDPGITLLIPFDDKNTLYTTNPGSDKEVKGTALNNKLYRKLTMANGAKITVNGAISVGSMHTSGDSSGQWNCGSPCGFYGQIDMQSGSAITVNNGGVLYAWGYVTGSGKVDVQAGGSVYEMFQLQGFRGGSYTVLTMLNDSRRVLPFSQYYVQNVEVEMTLYPGANEYVRSNIYMLSADNPSTIQFIGGSGSMFNIGSGAWVTKEYDPSTDRLIVSVNGSTPESTVSVEAMSVSFKYYTTITVNSSDFVLPINNNITINVNSGTAELTEDVALLAGAQVNVADGATLYIADGKSVYLYDETEWKSGQYVHNGMHVKPVTFSPTKTKTRGNGDLPDAVMDVNGYVLVEGYLYTTASGANITSSEGTGVVDFWNAGGDETNTYQATNSAYYDIPINNAWLKNADGSFVKTADEISDRNGGAYFYDKETGKWALPDVVYNANDGTGTTKVVPIDNILTGIANEKIPVEYTLDDNSFTRTGYTFTGWNTQADGKGTSYEAGDTVEIVKATTFYAQWELNSFDATFNAGGGAWADGETTKTVEDVTFGTAITAPENPTRTGYTFAGWSPEVGTMDEEGKTFTAQWTANSYDATFDANGGAWADDETTKTVEDVTFGTAITAPENPTRTGYTFAGWSPTVGTMDEEGKTFTAQWTANSYDATFDANGGAWADGESTKTVSTAFDSAITPPADPTREGYTFAGWSPEVGTMDEEGKTFTAQWAVNSYKLTIDFGDTTFFTVYTDADGNAYGGSQILPQSLTLNMRYGQGYSSIIIPGSKTGHSFSHFEDEDGNKYELVKKDYLYAGSDQTVKFDTLVLDAMPAKDLTLKPVWTINSYTITWKVDGETVQEKTYQYGADVDAEHPADPSKTGYTFNGWDKEVPVTMPNYGVTITARWTPNQHTVTLDLGEDSFGSYSHTSSTTLTGTVKNDYYYGDKVIIPIMVSSKTGYTFSHFEDQNGTRYELQDVQWNISDMEEINVKAIVIDSMPDADLTLKDVWTANEYTVTWNVDGVTTTSMQTYDANLVLPEAPTKEGFTFKGWFTAAEGGYKVDETTVFQNASNDTVYYAQWEAKTYTVTWKIGNYSTTTTATYGEAIAEPTVEVPENYHGCEWTTEIPETMPDNEQLVIEGYWTVKLTMLARDGMTEMTSVYDLIVPVGGTVTASYIGDTNYEYGHTLYLVNVADENEKYEITYSSGSAVYPTITLNENKTVKLIAVPNAYTLTFKAGYTGENSTEETVVKTLTFGEAVPSVTFTRKGYSLTGWMDEEGYEVDFPATVPGYNATYTAIWTANTYDATFNAGGGAWADGDTTVTTKAVSTVYGEAIEAPADPTRTGYTFAGWSPEVGTMDEEGMTFTAQWTPNIYDVTVAYSTVTTDQPKATYGQTYTANLSAPEGAKIHIHNVLVDNSPVPHTFVDNVLTIEGQYVTGNVHINAVPMVDFTIYANGGDVIAEENPDYEITETYIKGKVLYSTTSMVATDMLETLFSRTGYTAVGLNTQADGKGTNYAIGESVTFNADTELYVVWQVNTYDITVTVDGNEYTVQVPYGLTAEELAEKIAAEGISTDKVATVQYAYTFEGWDADGDGDVDGLSDVTGAASYTAVYTETEREYTIWVGSPDGEWTGYTSGENAYTDIIGHLWSFKGDEFASVNPGHTLTGLSLTIDGDIFAGTDAKGTVSFKITDDLLKNADEDGNIYLYGIYEVNTYTVTWKVDGDKTTEQVAYGTEIVLPTEPTKTGYVFAGWSGYIDGMTMPANDVEFTATWTALTYDIHLDINGDGAVDKTIQASHGATLALDDGSKAADKVNTYTFLGWSVEKDGEVITGDIKVTGEATYYAVFQADPIIYTITLDEQGGSDVADLTGGYEAKVILPELTKAGHTFLGWAETTDPNAEALAVGSEYTITDNDTLYAKWQINQYTITFVTDGGTEIPAITQDYGTDITAPADPTKEGHTFVSWDKEIPETMPAEDMTITAQWEINTYTIGWDIDGDGVAEHEDIVEWNVVPVYDVEKYGEVTKESTVDTVYTFDGWTVEPAAAAADVVYTAKFKTSVREYIITWIIEGVESTSSVGYGNVPTWSGEAPVKPDDNYNTYTFDKWVDTAGNEPVAVVGEATYTAQFTPTAKVYTLTIDLDGGAVGEQTAIVIEGGYGMAIDAIADPTKTGYTFDKWSEEIPTELTETKTIKALWTINQYTLTIDPGNGSEPITITQDYGTAIEKIADPIREGHTFTGWAPAIPATMPAEDMEIVAGWSINQYTITFDTAGGSEIAPITQDYGTAIEEITDPTREGYTFVSWDKEIPATMPAESIKLTAIWEANENSITIYLEKDDEEVYCVITAKTDEDITEQLPEEPTKEGHTFGGWVDKDGNPVVLGDKMPTTSMELYAKWNVTEYTITFELDGGKIGEQTVYTIVQDYGTAVTAPEDPTKEGYTFDKWVTKDGEGNETEYVVPETMPAQNVTVYAKWTVNQYTITFQDDSGNVLFSDTLDYGTVIEVPEVTKKGHSFVKWNETIPATMPARDVVITSEWNVNQYTITLNVSGGSAIDPITADYGAALTKPADPTKTGYTFTGWDVEFPATMPEGGLTLTAQWTINQYTITWKNWDGTELSTSVVDYGQMPAYEGTPARAASAEYSYNFIGWNTAADGSGEDLSAVSGAAVYYAQYERIANEYTITFNTAGGSEIAPITQGYGTDVTAPADPTREGYVFTGWDKDIPETMPAENVTITAQWEKVKYTITFDSDGGSEVASITAGWGEKISLPADPTKEGHSFAGWANAEGEIVTLPETMPVGGLEVKAVWNVNQYTITFDSNGGSEIAPITQDYGTAVTVPEAPSKDGYTFQGWSPELPETMPASDMTVVAQWKYTYTGWKTEEGGITYLIEGEKHYFGEWAVIDGQSYYFDDLSYVLTDICKTTAPDGSHEGLFVFDLATGAFRSELTGVYTSLSGDTYYVVNGEADLNAGLVRTVTDSGVVEYYYFCYDTVCNLASCPHNGTAVKNGIHWVEKNNGMLVKWDYTFDENGVIVHHEDTSRQRVHEDENGVECYYIDGVKVHYGLFMIGDDYYYARSNGELVKNRSYWVSVTNGLMKEGNYEFDETGKMIIEKEPADEVKNGIYAEDGSLFYYKDGKRTYAGLIEIDGEYYYVKSNCEAVHGGIFYITKTNGLMKAGNYNFDDDGKMIPMPTQDVKNGIVEENGGLYYYKDGKLFYAGLIEIDGYFYYVNSSCKVITGQKYWISKTNGLMPEKAYTFDETGRMVMD